MRSKKIYYINLVDRGNNEMRVKTDPSTPIDKHKKNFSLNEQNLKDKQLGHKKK